MPYRLTVLLLLLALAGCSNPATVPEADRAKQAWDIASARIRRGQSTSGSAVTPPFDSPDTKTEKLSDDRYRFTSWVESPNAVGEITRAAWTCIVVYDGSGQWRVEDYALTPVSRPR